MKQNDIKITTEMIKDPEFVRPGPDGVQGYCRKKLTTLHELIAK